MCCLDNLGLLKSRFAENDSFENNFSSSAFYPEAIKFSNFRGLGLKKERTIPKNSDIDKLSRKSRF